MDMTEWAGYIVQYFDMMSERQKQQIKSVIADSFEGWLAGIETARGMNVPIAMDFSLAALASLAFNRGGSSPGSTDTVPAMLTPGEWVINRPAAAKYGSGLLHAINSMQVPRAALQNMLAPPQVRRFAMGGPVSFSAPERGMAAAGGNSVTVNVNASAADLLSADNVRRWIIPVLDGINKRSR